jgi:hypothetical protein
MRYKPVLLSGYVLYGCETSPVTVQGERMLRVFRNRVQSMTLAPKGDEMVGGWGNQHNDDLRNLSSSSSISI